MKRPLGVATQMDELSDTSSGTAGIDLFDVWGFDRFPELSRRSEHVLGKKTREHRRTQTGKSSSTWLNPRKMG